MILYGIIILKIFTSKITNEGLSGSTITANFSGLVTYRSIQVINYWGLKDNSFDVALLSDPRASVVAPDGNYSETLTTTTPRELVIASIFSILPTTNVDPFIVGSGGWIHRGGGEDPPYAGFSWTGIPWYFCEDKVVDIPSEIEAIWTPDGPDYYSTVIASFKPIAEDQFFEIRGMCTDNTFLYLIEAGDGVVWVPKIIKRRCDDLSYVSSVDSFNSGDFFNDPVAITTNGNYLYVTDNNSGGRVIVFLKSDLSYVDQFASVAALAFGIDNDGSYLYVSTQNLLG